MATNAVKRTPVKKPVEAKEPDTKQVEDVKRPVRRQYSADDRIPCTSITSGEYLFEGEKSKTIYSWMDAGITEEMRYDDLTSAVRTRKPCIFKPRIIINDEEFLKDYPEIQRLYDSMYSKDDLTEILDLPADQMIEVIKQLPDGAKDAIKNMSVREIESGRLDSVLKVKYLDQYFGTDMLLKLAQ